MLEGDLDKIGDYPRVEIVEDKNGVLLNVLERNSKLILMMKSQSL